jgi:TPR repeat protein
MYESGNGVEADIGKAIECYQLAVYDNDPTGMYNLAQCYYYGKGIVKENKKRGLYYMTEAAEGGFVNAMKFLASVYFEMDRFEDCVYWAEQAAQAGDVEAQVYIARCYADGSVVDMDKAKAFAWYMKAAEQGDANAMTEVGAYYADGTVCAANADEAFKWFKMAAATETYAPALSCLALCYELGIGTKVDLKEAERLEGLAEALLNKA